MILSLIVILVSLSVCSSDGVVFSSPHKLFLLFEKEEVIIRNLQMATNFYKSDKLGRYINSCKPRLAEIRNYPPQRGDKNTQDLVWKKLVGNPLHVFSLIHRLVTQLPLLLEELASQDRTASIEQDIRGLLEGTILPSDLDLEGVMQGVARVQFAYRLDPVDLAEGNIAGKNTEAQLTVEQMMEVARSRYTGTQRMRNGIGKETAMAIEWAEGALELSMKQNATDNINSIEEFLAEARQDHDNRWPSPVGQRGNIPNEEFFVSRIRDEQKGDLSGKYLRRQEAIFLDEEPPNPEYGYGFNVHDFFALCRGEQVKHSPPPQTIPCLLTTKGEPYFILAPIKQEVVSVEPSIILFHGIITDGEIDFMTTKTLEQLQAATVQDVDDVTGGGGKLTNERTQSTSWLWDYEDDIIYKLAKKTGKVTGLETHRPKDLLLEGKPIIEAEAWQLGLYVPGGHYLPHWDAFEIMDPKSKTPDEVWVGNRIATVMFYLSDVVGGSTAFPLVGVAAQPSKGTAVFWYNQHRHGGRDQRTLHGACPTLMGLKWVSNKWIREGSQIWRRSCTSETE